jgi:hypothetical protein
MAKRPHRTTNVTFRSIGLREASTKRRQVHFSPELADGELALVWES